MFDKQTVGLYKSISAPDSLQKRVAALNGQSSIKHIAFPASKRRASFIATASSLAAAVLLYCAIALPGSSPVLSIGGENPVSGAVAVSLPATVSRAAPAALAEEPFTGQDLRVECAVQTDCKTEISVTAGSLTLPESTKAGIQTLTVSQDTVFVWELDGLYHDSREILAIQSGTKTERFLLEYDTEDSVWLLKSAD